MSNNDLIRLGDVMELLDLAEHDAEERNWRSGANEMRRLRNYVAALPAVADSKPADPVRVTVKPLVFDDLGIASDDLLNQTIVYYKKEDQDRHNATRAARILSAIDVQPYPRDAQIAALVDENNELKRKLGGGCDANNGMDHLVISEGKYKFCGKCGETLHGVRFNHMPRAVKGGDA